MEEPEILMGSLSGENWADDHRGKMSKIKIGLRLRWADTAFKEEVFSFSGNGRRNTFSQDFHCELRGIGVWSVFPREEERNKATSGAFSCFHLI